MLKKIKYELHIHRKGQSDEIAQYRLSQAAINDGREAMNRKDVIGYEVIDLATNICIAYDGKWWEN